MYPNILRLSMFMGLLEGQWTLLVSSCLRSTNRVNLGAREHADSQNIWIHPRMCVCVCCIIRVASHRRSDFRAGTSLPWRSLRRSCCAGRRGWVRDTSSVVFVKMNAVFTRVVLGFVVWARGRPPSRVPDFNQGIFFRRSAANLWRKEIPQKPETFLGLFILIFGY